MADASSSVSFLDSVSTFDNYPWNDVFWSWDAPFTVSNWEQVVFDLSKININDSLLFSEHSFNRHSVFVADKLSMGDAFYNDVVLDIHETVNFDVVCNHGLFYALSFFSSFSFSDASAFSLLMPFFQKLSLIDECLSGFDFLISNLSFFTKNYSFNELESAATRPYGYSNFQEFKVGEYDYEKAMIKVTVDSPNLNFSSAIDSLTLHVDIPDTDDRGVSSVNASDTYITFNKKYYNPPEEVALAIKGGVTGTALSPKLVSVDTEGFHVFITDSSGNMVAGQISWAAKGY